MGTRTDNHVHHSKANSGLGDCGTAPSGSAAAGTWGPITHRYAHEGTYTACVVIYDIHYSKPILTWLTAALSPTKTTFRVRYRIPRLTGEVLLIGSEQMRVTGVAGTTVTVDRHVNGTRAASHRKNAAVRAIVLASPKELVAGSNYRPYSTGDHNSDNSAEQNGLHSGRAQCLPITFTVGRAPKVTSTTPADGTSGVATQSQVTIHFSRSVNATGSAFRIKCPTGNPESFSQSATPASSVTLTPTAPLPAGTVCKVTVVASQVTDAATGGLLPTNYVFSFTTDTAPTVTSTSPQDGASGVATTSAVTVNFSEPVNASTSSFTLECPSGTPIAYTLSSSPASSFTLTPSSNLPSGAVCTVTVDAAHVSDTDANTPLQANYVFSFTVDTVATVTSTVPANGATVASNSKVTITFSEPVLTTGSSFSLECPGGTPIAFAQSSSALTYTLTPASALPVETTCTVNVDHTQVHDVDSGSPMAADYSFSFYVAAPPTVTSTAPADAATNVPLTSAITINFDRSVNASTSSFDVVCPTGTPITYALSPSPASSYTLRPAENLPGGVICTVTVVASQVTDASTGTPMDGNYNFSFTVDTPPTVTSTIPADVATHVSPNTTITVNFSELVYDPAFAFTIECGSTQIVFNESGSPATSYTLTPTSPLPAGTTCQVTVNAASFTDLAGSPMARDYYFSFTTDTPPAVVSTVPADRATDVALASKITLNFNQSVSATNAFSLECPAGNPVSFNTSPSPASSYTLTPTSDLPANTSCTVTAAASGITDAFGTNMASDYTFAFDTVLPPPVAVDDGPSTDYSATGGVPIDIASAGVLANDTLNGGSISSYGASTGSEDTSIGTATPTAQGGFVTLNADGSFHYDPPSIPPAGGTDSFKYTLTNAGGSSTATVTLNVANQVIFVNGSSAVTPKTGSLDHPYTSLSEITSSRNTDGVLFFYSGSYTRSDADGVTLKNGEYLIGQGVSLASNLPFALAPDSVPLPGASTNPTISTSFASGSAVVLGLNNTVKGVTAGAAPYYSILGGPGFGTLSISNASIDNTGSGGGLSLGSGAVAAGSSLDSVSASPTGSGSGLAFSSVTGSLTINGGSVSANSSGYAFTSNSSVDVTDNGSLSQAGAGALLYASGTGTLTFQTGSLSATGGAGLLFQNADGTYTLANGATLSGGAAVSITSGSSGTMNLNATTITNPGGAAFTVTGSSATMSDSGAISKTSSGQLVDIESNTGGSVTLSGNLSATGSASGIKLANNSSGTYTFSGATKTLTTGANDAVALTSNTGATIHFYGGGLAATTTTANGFTATGGGTVDVTGGANTISSTTGTALDVESTTIGASGLNFQSISSNGANPGINLSSTGTSGGLTVTGASSAGTGGTIQNAGSAGEGINLSSTSAPSFTDMLIENNGADGIIGSQVNGLTLADSTVSGNGTQANVSGENDDGLDFSPNGTGSPNGLTGTVSISGSTITGSADNNAIISDTSGSLNLTVTGSTFSSNNSTTGNDGLHIDANGSTNATVSVTGSTFTNNFGDHFQFSTGSTSSGTNSVTFSNNQLNSTAAGVLGGGVVISPFGNSHTTLQANGNNIQKSVFTGIAIDESGSTGTLSGTVANNTIGTAATANSGSQGNDIGIFAEGSVTETLAITGNTLFQYGNEAGISFLDREGDPAMNLTITSNTIADPGTFGSWGVLGQAGATSGDSGAVCLAMTGNSVKGSAQSGQGGADLELDQEFNTAIELPGYTGTSRDTAAVVAFVTGNNTGNGTPSGIATTSGSGGGFTGGTSCLTP